MYNLKTVTYHGEQEITIYQKTIKTGYKESEENIRKRVEARKKDVLSLRSIEEAYKRTRAKIYDYARANEWEWFVTWTFSQEKVKSRYDYEELAKKMTYWLNNVRKRRSKDLKYLIVPELHKDGALHFHGLMANIGNMTLVDSGRRDKRRRKVYNIEDYQLGFTTATRVSDTKRAANYITKYITKTLIVITKDRKRYWISRNLEKGEVEKELVDEEGKEEIREMYGGEAKHIKKVEVKKKDFEQVIEIYTI